MKAAGNGHTAIVELLLACPNIQINLVDNKGWSALMKAARYGHEAITKLLLARPEIQVNLVDSNGSSALSLAAYGGHTTIVGLLLARPHISTATRRLDDWETAMSVASDNGHMEIVQLLREIELRQAGSDPQDSSTGTVTDQEQLALEEPVDAEVRSGYDSEDSQPYHDAEEWLEVDGVVYA
ncbi:ankyrin repeat-containing domain protein [Coprinopsis sp. MPI-PUGE-AT-0042]|nr:ankyrin repeat-containing domain protein [Coprinopsis sp. MPI-PUGE-AT-0042]